MELINKKHEAITQNIRVNLAEFFKIESDKEVYFSAGAVEKYGLFPGLYIHFQNDEERWYFYCNNDTDGFPLTAIGGWNRKATAIYNKALVYLIKKRTCMSIGTKFPIQLTNAKIHNDHLFEINFSKPFEIKMLKKKPKNSPVIKINTRFGSISHKTKNN